MILFVQSFLMFRSFDDNFRARQTEPRDFDDFLLTLSCIHESIHPAARSFPCTKPINAVQHSIHFVPLIWIIVLLSSDIDVLFVQCPDPVAQDLSAHRGFFRDPLPPAGFCPAPSAQVSGQVDSLLLIRCDLLPAAPRILLSLRLVPALSNWAFAALA